MSKLQVLPFLPVTSSGSRAGFLSLAFPGLRPPTHQPLILPWGLTHFDPTSQSVVNWQAPASPAKTTNENARARSEALTVSLLFQTISWTDLRGSHSVVSDKSRTACCVGLRLRRGWGQSPTPGGLIAGSVAPIIAAGWQIVDNLPSKPLLIGGTTMTTKQLEDRFHLAMLGIYKSAKRECDYNATRFLQMVVDKGGLATARYLINTPTVSDGYAALWERGRLDLTVEALVLEDQWSSLFTDEELSIARDRLIEYGYKGLH